MPTRGRTSARVPTATKRAKRRWDGSSHRLFDPAASPALSQPHSTTLPSPTRYDKRHEGEWCAEVRALRHSEVRRNRDRRSSQNSVMAKLAEIVKREVLRISLPRTRVNREVVANSIGCRLACWSRTSPVLDRRLLCLCGHRLRKDAPGRLWCTKPARSPQPGSPPSTCGPTCSPGRTGR